MVKKYKGYVIALALGNIIARSFLNGLAFLVLYWNISAIVGGNTGKMWMVFRSELAGAMKATQHRAMWGYFRKIFAASLIK